MAKKSGVYTAYMNIFELFLTQPYLLKHGQAQSFFNKRLNNIVRCLLAGMRCITPLKLHGGVSNSKLLT